ncbi:MAG: hypothetical protein ACRBG0_16295 [Lewinella sp.]|uniref:hypothetical protein n=1 Tax=Lewinella sp. TaxID=2004506 RepID=UPI003D6AC603
MRVFCLSMIFCTIFFTCEKEKEEITIESCNAIYGIDITFAVILDPVIWLNDAADNVIFQDGETGARGTTYFLNTIACEEEYTLSIAGRDRVELLEEGETNRIVTRQIAQVGQGSGIRLAAIQEVFLTSVVPISPSDLVVFRNSPEVDSIIFMGLAGERDVTGPRPPVSYSYEEEEQELRVYFNGFASDNTKGLLAVRLAASGAWVGQEVDFLSRATFGPFVGFEPLEYKTLTLNIPADVTAHQFRVSWLNDNISISATVLGDFENTSSASLLVPSDGNGFLIRTVVPGEATYLNQQYFEQWPTEVNVTPRYFLDEARLSYPTVSIYSNDGDVVFLENDYVSPGNNGRYWKRQYVAPLDPNFTSVQIPMAESSLFSGSYSLGWSYSDYKNSFDEEVKVSVYDYPLLSDGYQGFLRDAFRISNSQEGWLRTQVYEAVSQRIID